MKIGLVIPFHLKGRLSNLCYDKTFEHYIYCDCFNAVRFCGSEFELSQFFMNSHYWLYNYREVPQASITTLSAGDDVLRKKFNDSLKTLPKNLDWYCLAGADDIASVDFFENLKQLDPSGIKMAGVGMDQPLYILDEKKAWNAHRVQIKYQIKLDLLPGINCFSRDAMEACGWEPYQRRGCETGAELLFRDLGQVVPLKGSITMLKGDGVLNPLSKILKFHKQIPLTEDERVYLRTLV